MFVYIRTMQSTISIDTLGLSYMRTNCWCQGVCLKPFSPGAGELVPDEASGPASSFGSCAPASTHTYTHTHTRTHTHTCTHTHAWGMCL